MKNTNGCTEVVAAVIRRAICDLKLINHKKPELVEIGLDAYEFLAYEGLEIWCKVVGLNPDYIRKEIGKTNDLFKEYTVIPKTVE